MISLMVEIVETRDVEENVLDECCDNQFQESSLSVEAQILEVNNLNTEAENKIKAYLKCRLEPINEVVLSERSYVRLLKTISEKYIPLMEDNTVSLPDDLANKWRIIWGNWIQLDEWHSNFLEKLENIIIEDPDLIPKLFLDSRARLRTIYSKYCENYRKAIVIAEQYKDFFDERRVSIGDKQDVISHLMQPIQRIMRYQLPISLIVKLTKCANLPSIYLWERALEVMKEIPKEAQLILEASRIDGFPHSVTALGNICMRGQLYVATITKAELEREGFSLSDLKFLDRRVFLFDQMLLVTEEVKLKRKDPFTQSTYFLRHSINLNKMKFHPRCTFVTVATQADPDSMFMICEETRTTDKVYIFDPVKADIREQWVVHLKGIQRMQQELLLALQDPKRFANKVETSGKEPNLIKPVPDSDPSKAGTSSSKKNKKWLNFNSSGSVLIKYLRPRVDKNSDVGHAGLARENNADRKSLQVNNGNTNDNGLNKSPDSTSVNEKGANKDETCMLNDDDPLTTKQVPKTSTNCHSKSDELGVSNCQSSGTSYVNAASTSAPFHKKKSGNFFHMFSNNRNKTKAASTSTTLLLPQNND